jgi:hypothetical protein
MRLSEFIVQHVDRIVDEWEVFAEFISADDSLDRTTLRDHAKSILLAASADMSKAQTACEQAAKAKGEGPEKTPGMESCATTSGSTWCK